MAAVCPPWVRLCSGARTIEQKLGALQHMLSSSTLANTVLPFFDGQKLATSFTCAADAPCGALQPHSLADFRSSIQWPWKVLVRNENDLAGPLCGLLEDCCSVVPLDNSMLAGIHAAHACVVSAK